MASTSAVALRSEGLKGCDPCVLERQADLALKRQCEHAVRSDGRHSRLHDLGQQLGLMLDAFGGDPANHWIPHGDSTGAERMFDIGRKQERAAVLW
ncbi:MAG: hypothetical protein AB9873_08805 [Syntrophobacteraceae bacterium]